jgi:putative ABC transport system substrate-binding protein
MRRREFITFVGGVAAFPLAVRAQQTIAPTLGVLLVENREPFSRLFSEGLRDLGYINGQNIRIEFRFAQGNLSQLPELAADLVRLKVDIIIASETPAVLAAKRATSEIPIVMAPSGDPVGTGLIASLARPGGNVTGLSAATAELAGKSLELIREILPGVRRVAALADPTNAFTKPFLEQIHRAAAAANLEIEAIMVRGGEEFEAAFAQMTRRGIEAVIVQPTLPRAPIVELAKKNRVAPMRAASCRMPAASLIATEMQRHTWTRFLKV